MTWNHRVIAYINKDADTHFAIEEVYYNGDKTPRSYAKDSVVCGDNVEELKWVLERMQAALDKPILSADNFPEEYKPEYKTT